MDRPAPPVDYEELIRVIHARYDAMSKGYQAIALYLTQNPNDVAVRSVNAIAERCGVHASNFVRFAQSLGYSGFRVDCDPIIAVTDLEGTSESPQGTKGRMSRRPGFFDQGKLLQGLLDFRVEKVNQFPIFWRLDERADMTGLLSALLDLVQENGFADTAQAKQDL